MIVYLVCYAASLLLALSRHYLLSGAGLLAAAVYLYASDYIRSGNLLHLRGIFALSFVGGQGLACMKLSYLSQAWSAGTWLGLLAAFAGFYLAFYYLEAFSGEDIVIDDLYAVINANKEGYISGDYIHPSKAGVNALAKAAAKCIRRVGKGLRPNPDDSAIPEKAPASSVNQKTLQ